VTIKYRKGNLLDLTAGVIVHGCNMQGVMGSGVAKAIKDKYPKCYTAYVEGLNYDCKLLGDVIWYVDVEKEITIANALTQEFYGRNPQTVYVSYDAISSCFKEVVKCNKGFNDPIYFPKIGAGLGGGDWSIIEQLINDTDPKDEFEKICYEI
jgi:O-acetyl-ADP-ribose deacetylase (regulator of RNase III)